MCRSSAFPNAGAADGGEEELAALDDEDESYICKTCKATEAGDS